MILKTKFGSMAVWIKWKKCEESIQIEKVCLRIGKNICFEKRIKYDIFFYLVDKYLDRLQDLGNLLEKLTNYQFKTNDL